MFTLPAPIAAIAFQNKALVYAILFAASAQAMATLASNPRRLGARIGGLAVLHTWGQTLTHHPHVHCIVPGGGLSSDGTRWVRGRPTFFLAVKPLAKLFRRLFLERLRQAFDTGALRFFGDLAALAEPAKFDALMAEMRAAVWVVYAKKPFGGPAQALAYLGRYTHRVAIANSRLVAIEDNHVAFTWKTIARTAPSSVGASLAKSFFFRVAKPDLPSTATALTKSQPRTKEINPCRSREVATARRRKIRHEEGLAFAETRSRNTAENAAFAFRLLQPQLGQRWVLVTSAYHMPRAVGCFRAVGFEVEACPVDYLRSGDPHSWVIAWRELVALLGYHVLGRTATLFPGPYQDVRRPHLGPRRG